MRIPFAGFAAGVFLSALFNGVAYGFTLRPELSVAEEYTDNFFVAETGKAGEWTTRLSPALVLTHKTRDLLFSGKYVGGAALYARHDAENRYRHGLVLDVGLPVVSRFFRGVRARVTEVAEQSPERHVLPFGDTTGAFFGASLGRIQTFRNRASLNVDARWSSLWASTLIYSNTATRYEGSVLEDRVVHETSLSQAYFVPRARRQIAAAYGILNSDYERAGKSWAQRVSITGTQALGKTLSLKGGGGKSWTQDGFSVTTINAGLTRRIKRTVLDASYFRDIEAGEGVRTALGVSQRYVLKTVYAIGTRTALAFKLDYRDENDLSGVIADSRSTSVTPSLATRFSPVLSGSVLYTYLDYQEQGTTPLDAESHVVAFMLQAFPAGWRVAP